MIEVYDPWTIYDSKGYETFLANGLEFGFAAMRGWYRGIGGTLMTELKPAKLPQGCSFFVVFDLHVGRMIADLASKKVTEQLANVMTTDVFSDGNAEDADLNKIGKAIRDALLYLDREISKKHSDPNGCVIAAPITPAHIIVANAGDSRCVLTKASHAVAMSFDQVESEGESSTQADICLRQPLKRRSVSLDSVSTDNVYAEPDIKVHRIDKTEEFLVLVRGGNWDHLSNIEVCAYIRQLMTKGKTDLNVIAEEILDNCPYAER